MTLSRWLPRPYPPGAHARYQDNDHQRPRQAPVIDCCDVAVIGAGPGGAATATFLALAFYTEDFHFAQLARIPEQRQGLIDLLTGIVGTCEAAVVTDKIRDFFGERAAFLEGQSEGRA